MKSWINHLLILLALQVGSITTRVLAADPVLVPAKENFHLYLLVGQSNMAGRGRVGDADRLPHPRVLMFTQQWEWALAVDPLHFDKPTVVGVGLGKTFGLEMAADDPTVVIGLIPCAVGGSGIDSWTPGGLHAETNTHPWDDTLVRAKAALEYGTLRGILWHQGESDSTPNLAAEYKAKLHSLVTRFRAELGSPEVPFIAGQMGQFPERPWNEHFQLVDAAHQTLPETLSHTAFVVTVHTPGSSDGGF